MAPDGQARVQDPVRRATAWFYPVRQSLAATLLRSGRSEGGIRLPRGDQKATARRPAALRPVVETAQKRDSEAALVEQQFNAAWEMPR